MTDHFAGGPAPGTAVYCETLSGRKVHLSFPVPFKKLTVCRQVIYAVLNTEQARGRRICAQCMRKLERPAGDQPDGRTDLTVRGGRRGD